MVSLIAVTRIQLTKVTQNGSIQITKRLDDRETECQVYVSK